MDTQRHPALPILIIDDEDDVLQSYKLLLRYNGFDNLILCKESQGVAAILEDTEVSTIMLDLNMPNTSGYDILAHINEKHPGIPVIVVTAIDKVDSVVLCMKKGAFDYITKPVEKDQLLLSINRALEYFDLKAEVMSLSKRILSRKPHNPELFSEIITNNENMKSIFRYIEAIAASKKPVLITGESGTGKEMIARVIYKQKNLSGKFIPLNVAGLDDNVFSDTLFGHVKGAFTGADTARSGLIQQAEDGILFLDEIGDLDMRSQVKLLRLLQEKEYAPLGSDTLRSTNAQIIAATNVDLENMVENSVFRKDLFYRLATHRIHLPSLRERMDDLPLLIDHFVNDACISMNKKVPSIPKELRILLKNYTFPGNIREIQSMIFDAVARNQTETLSLSSFRDYIQNKTGKGISEMRLEDDKAPISFENTFPTLREVEEYLIKEAMERSEGNQSIAAQLLGISQSTLSRRFKNKNQVIQLETFFDGKPKRL